MKKDDSYRRKIILESLHKNSNVALACNNVGISRQTYYRWQREDILFKEECEEAIRLGIEENCDLTEAKLMQKISEGYFPAIKFLLQSNSHKYILKKPMEHKKHQKMSMLDLAKKIADEEDEI